MFKKNIVSLQSYKKTSNMAYKSIDELQTLLSKEIFKDRSDNKKAAGRALGTFIEIIVYYLLRQWGENDSIAIESPLSEYGRE